MVPVRIELLGRACMAIRSGKHELVIDPWLSEAARLGGVRAYPELDAAALGRLHARIDHATHVFISSEGSDRFEPELLANLSPKVLVTAQLRSTRLRHELEALRARGHSLHVLGSGETLALDGRACLRAFAADPRWRARAALLLHTPFGDVLVDPDDALDPSALRAAVEHARVRVFAGSLSFVAGEPLAAELRGDDPELRAKLAAARDLRVERFRAALRATAADLGLVIGGPLCFADAVNLQLNRHPEAMDWSGMVARLDGDSCVLWPAPGAVFELGDEGVAPLELLDFDSLLRNGPPPSPPGPAPAETAVDGALLERAANGFVTRAGGVLESAGARCELPLYVSAVRELAALDSGELAFSLRLELDRERRSVTRVDSVTAQPPFLQIVSTPQLLHGFLSGAICWDELLRSGRARLRRDPAGANALLHAVLHVCHDPDASAALVESLRAQPPGAAGGEPRPSDAR